MGLIRWGYLLAAAAAGNVSQAQPAARAGTPVFQVAEHAWICPAYGWLTNATDDQRAKHCMPAILGGIRIVPLDYAGAATFVCFPIRGTLGLLSESLYCGYALTTSIVDDRGRPVGAVAVQRAAASARIADVHSLP